VRLSGKIYHGAWTMVSQDMVDPRAVANVTLNKAMTLVVHERRQIGEVASVGKLVKIHNRFIAAGQPSMNEIASNEAGATGNEDSHELGTLVAVNSWSDHFG
jgi:hypothetical protein